jgi:hypothetical protein
MKNTNKRKILTMAHAHPTDQPRNRSSIKDVADHAIGLALVKSTFGTARNNTARILASMLKKGQPLRDLSSSVYVGVVQKKTKDPAHYHIGSGLE